MHRLADGEYEELVIRAPADEPLDFAASWAEQRGLDVISVTTHPEMTTRFAHAAELHGVSFGSDDHPASEARYARFAESLSEPNPDGTSTGRWIVTSLHHDPALSWEERFTMIAAPDAGAAIQALRDSQQPGDDFRLVRVVACVPTPLNGPFTPGEVLIRRRFARLDAWRDCFQRPPQPGPGIQ
ncbi:hypothetical protein [Haliangium sp.]|uniref:hypothetical protein n=1 Tax=Haliangium sp. TaxID=2663208 RepID=UPI003D12777F